MPRAPGGQSRGSQWSNSSRHTPIMTPFHAADKPSDGFAAAADPGNLITLVDPALLPRLHTDRRALDGGRHATIEDVEPPRSRPRTRDAGGTPREYRTHQRHDPFRSLRGP